MSHMTIPEIREELLEIADYLQGIRPGIARRLRYLAAASYRTRSDRPVNRVSPPMTASMAEAARRMATDNPDMSLQEIAAQFHVNSGRISEALAGKR